LQDDLVAGRDCGTCNVCCVDLSVDQPELQKLPGYPCHNCLPDGGCAIYDARPQTCRRYYCGWRRLDWIGPALRPDVSGVLAQFRPAAPGTPGPVEMVFLLLRPDALKAAGLADAIAASVRSGMPTYLHVAGPPGYTASRVRIDRRLGAVVRQSDHAAILRVIQDLHVESAATPRRPVVLTSYDSVSPK
jgi:hypothetical protein